MLAWRRQHDRRPNRAVSLSSENQGTATHRRRGVAVNTAMNGVAQAANVVSTLVFFPLLVGAFGAEQYGVYVIATSAVGFFLLFDLGVGASTVRLVAGRLSVGDTRGFSRVVSSSGVLFVAIGIVLALAMAGLAMISGIVFKVSPDQALLLTRLLFIGAGMQVLYWPTSLAVQVLKGLERYDLIARTSMLSTLISVISIGIVLATDSGPTTLMALGALTMAVSAAINFAAIYRVKPECGLFGSPGKAEMSELVSVGVPVFMVSVAQFLNKEQVDRLVIGVFIGPAGLVVYEVAAKLSTLITQVAALPTSALLPVVSGMAARDDRAAMRRLFLEGGRYITLALLPVVVTLAVLAGPFIGVWFGGEYPQSVTIAHLLVLTQLFFVPLLVGDSILTGTGRISVWVRWAAVVALTNLGLSVILVGVLGPTGVALATLIASLVELPLFARIALRESGVSLREWLLSIRLPYLLLPLPAVVAIVLAQTALGDSIPGIGVCGVVAVCVYWVAAWAFVLDRDSRADVVSRLRSRS